MASDPGSPRSRDSDARPGDQVVLNESVDSESVEALTGHLVPDQIVDTTWRQQDAVAAKRATLRVYLGAAPGVGKTYAMLGEGQRRRSRGTDVVVGYIQTYGRRHTAEMLEGLEVVPTRTVDYRGTTFQEMDAAAIVARAPEVVLVDELAHTNVPGSRRAKRWEDVLDLLAEGILVITTVNIQHLESLNDVIATITGVRQQETVPDWVLDLADQVELVDMSPQALRRRMVHGNIYPDPRKAELALQRYFTEENLTALRELALMRVANRVDEELLVRWGAGRTLETRERVLVCVSRPEFSDQLVRRGARIAQRAGGDLLVLHVRSGEGESDRTWLEEMDRLARDLGGEFQEVVSDSPVQGVLSLRLRPARHADRGRRAAPFAMERARPGELRQPADPTGLEHRRPRHRPAGTLTPDRRGSVPGQLEVQREDVHPGFAEEPERPPLGVPGDEIHDRVERQAANVRDTGRLEHGPPPPRCRDRARSPRS